MTDRPDQPDLHGIDGIEHLYIPCPTSNVWWNISTMDDYFLLLTRGNGVRMLNMMMDEEAEEASEDYPGGWRMTWGKHPGFLHTMVLNAEEEWLSRDHKPDSISIVLMSGRIATRPGPPPSWWGREQTHDIHRRIMASILPDYYVELFMNYGVTSAHHPDLIAATKETYSR